MKVVIFGGAGFVGSNIARYLLETTDNLQISAVDNTAHMESVRVLCSNKRFEFYLGTVLDPCFVEMMVANADVVINATSSHDEYNQTNLKVSGTQNILDYMVECQKYIHISSVSVYGNYKVYPPNETAPLVPGTINDAGQIGADALVEAYRRIGNKAIIFRPVFLFGPNDHKNNWLGKTFIDAVAGEAIPVYQSYIIELMHVDDLSRAILMVIHNFNHSECIYNLGSGVRLSFAEVAKIITNAIQSKSALTNTLNFSLKIGATSELAYNNFRWRPEMDVVDSLENTAHWYLKNK
jgi:dTDP-glucose 4,6-dehydratase